MKSYYMVVYLDKKSNEVAHYGELDTNGILINGAPTLFATYDKARNADKRSQTYAKRNKYPWYDYWYPVIRRAILPARSTRRKKAKMVPKQK